MNDEATSVRERVSALIDALQCAPMTVEALMHESGLGRTSLDAWLHAFEARGLVDGTGRAKSARGPSATLWRWKGPAS